MSGHLLAIVGLAVACAGWALLQRFIGRVTPEVRGIFDRGCGGHSCGPCEVDGCAREVPAAQSGEADEATST
jgi:hypothetical protein